jgi:hypothetical protein
MQNEAHPIDIYDEDLQDNCADFDFTGFECDACLVRTSRSAAAPDRPELIYKPRGNFEDSVARPLRYWPIAGDFVITNGAEFFNRPLYCLNSAFRIDGGDKPEFSLYLPGRGGNLRLGIKTSAGIKWLNDARQIVTRYRAGSLIYEIRDPLLGGGELILTTLPLSETKGIIRRAELSGAQNPVQFIWAFGGANGMRGSRDGDIGCERQPVSEFFQLRAEQCRDDVFSIAANTFTLRDNKTVIAGVASSGAQLFVGDAADWNSPDALLSSTNSATPLLVGQAALQSGQPVFFALQQLSVAGADELPVYRDVSKNQFADTNGQPVSIYAESDLPKVFDQAENHRRAIAEKVVVETPDDYINAAAAALNIAADAVWDDKQQAFMHGAVAWRTRLLGWRGEYAGDALGWHERTAAHFAGFAKNQNVSPIPRNHSAARRTIQSRAQRGRHSFQRRHVEKSLRHEPRRRGRLFPAPALDGRHELRR